MFVFTAIRGVYVLKSKTNFPTKTGMLYRILYRMILRSNRFISCHSMLCETVGVVSYCIVSYQVLFSNYINRSSVHESFGEINGKIQLISTRWLDVYSKWTAKLNYIVLTNIGPTKCTKPSQLCNLIAHNNVMNGLQPQSLLYFRAEVIILKQNIFGSHPFCHGCLQPFSSTLLLPQCLTLLVCRAEPFLSTYDVFFPSSPLCSSYLSSYTRLSSRVCRGEQISRMIRRMSATKSVRGRLWVGGVEFSCHLPPGVSEHQIIFVFRHCLVLLNVCYFNLIWMTA